MIPHIGLLTLSLLIPAILVYLQRARRPVDGTYDYVIVGGGTAGLALAARLAERPGISVAVIEAGGKYQRNSLMAFPSCAAMFVGADPADTGAVDWGFVTTPVGERAGIHYARGKCLGGSSGRNFMVYHRPDAGTMDQWAALVNDSSWSWESMLPYYQKSVRFTKPSPQRTDEGDTKVDFKTEAFAEDGGPLDVSYPLEGPAWSAVLKRAMAQVGIMPAPDFNSGSLLGSAWTSTTIHHRTQRRVSSQTAFLGEAQAQGRKNLRVFTHTMAKKILFDESKRATGVLTDRGTLAARNEVIVASGVFQSPQLLMVSGVGPRETLERHNIPVVADRPGVGRNLKDHVFFSLTHRVTIPTFTSYVNRPLKLFADLFWTYARSLKGILTCPPGGEFLGWEKAPRHMLPHNVAAQLDAQFPPSWPELEYIPFPVFCGDSSSVAAVQPKDGHEYASIVVVLNAPMSAGSVTVISPDTADAPVIDLNWLTHEVDEAVAIAGFKRAREMFDTEALRAVLVGKVDTENKGGAKQKEKGASEVEAEKRSEHGHEYEHEHKEGGIKHDKHSTVETEYFPGPGVRTDAESLSVIKKNAMTVFHAACTCRMGRPDDVTAVVDSKARVYGVTGLRVVDASAFALLPPGHPQATVYAFAEKIADDIKRELAHADLADVVPGSCH